MRENDGSVFTDILRTRKPRRAVAPSENAVPETRRSRHARRVPRLAEVTAPGFVPGEDVAVATIVSHTDATGTGEARSLIDLDDLPDASTPEVILFRAHLGRSRGAAADMNQRQAGGMGDELTNAALIGLIGMFGIALVLRAAGSVAAFLTGTPQPDADAAGGLAVLFNPGDPATALGAERLNPLV